MSISVLHTYRTYFPDPPGGLQEAIRQIATTTKEYGVDNTIFTLSPNPDPSVLFRPEGKVVRSRSWISPASCDLGALNAFSTFSQLASQSDVLHYFYPWPFFDILNAIVRPEQPKVLTYISDIVRQRFLGTAYSPLMWKTLKEMKVVVANSPSYARTSSVLSHPDVRDKVRVIPLGIEESSYSKKGDSSIFSRLGISKNEPYFLFVGVLRYYKGLHFLVSAAKFLDAKVIIAGSGPEEVNLRRLALEIGAKNVVFAGQISDAEKVSLIQDCRALVLPSHLRSEAFGMVLVEAAMFGRPLISCEIGTGTSYVNSHEESGIVVKPGIAESLFDAMNILLKDNHLNSTMGGAARARYERLFSGPALGRSYAALFHEVLSAS